MDAPLPEGLTDAWVEFLSQHRTLDDLFNHPILFPLQRRVEMEHMIWEAMHVYPRTLMDIGSDKGGGLWAWLACIPSLKRVIACEVRGTPYAEEFMKAFPHVEFLWLPMSSYDHNTVHTVSRFIDAADKDVVAPSIDVLFLDGDKSNFDTDFWLYYRWLSHRAVVFFHDVSDEAPKTAYLKVIQRGKFTNRDIIADRSDWEAAEVRQSEGLPAKTAHEGWLRQWRGKSCTVGVIRLGS